jgi:hypothetical protein
MKTLNLAERQITVEELLRSAADETLLIRSKEGLTFVLEATDAFDREVAELGASDRFMAFLAARSKEHGDLSLDEIDKRLAVERK